MYCLLTLKATLISNANYMPTDRELSNIFCLLFSVKTNGKKAIDIDK